MPNMSTVAWPIAFTTKKIMNIAKNLFIKSELQVLSRTFWPTGRVARYRRGAILGGFACY